MANTPPLPPIPIAHHDNFCVARGDMVRGGLKMPALLRYLPKHNHTHFAYVGTVFGAGAWAVAAACAELGFQCSLFIAQSDITPSWEDDIKKTGATLYWTPPSPVADIRHQIMQNYPDICHLPLGFDDPAFIQDMATVLKESITASPPEIWVPCISGVLVRAACLAFPDVPVHAVTTAKHHGNTGRAILHPAPEKFHHPAKVMPPYPACPFSCAKIWQFAKDSAVSGAVILNVGY